MNFKVVIYTAITCLLFFIPIVLFTVKTTRQLQAAIIIPTPTPASHDWQTYETLRKDNQIKQPQKILEVWIEYHAKSSQTFLIKKLSKVNGYIQTQANNDLPFMIQLMGKNNVLLEQHFAVPNIVTGHTAIEPDGTFHAGIYPLENEEFMVTMLWNDNATDLKITTRDGNEITHTNVSKAQEINNKPDFFALRATQFLKSDTDETSGTDNHFSFLIPSAYAAENKKTLNIAFIGDKYIDNNKFRKDIVQIGEKLVSYEPFKTRARQIMFYIINNEKNLGCYYNTQIGNSIICNDAVIKNELNMKSVPYDYIVTLLNNTQFGSTSIKGAASLYINNGEWMDNAFVHELGHVFGGLLDETLTEGLPSPAQQDNQIYNLNYEGRIAQGDGNCFAGTPPAAKWNNIADKISYEKNCTYPDWYASSENSIMRNLASISFNTVSQNVLQRRFSEKVGLVPVAVRPNFFCMSSATCDLGANKGVGKKCRTKKTGDYKGGCNENLICNIENDTSSDCIENNKCTGVCEKSVEGMGQQCITRTDEPDFNRNVCPNELACDTRRDKSKSCKIDGACKGTCQKIFQGFKPGQPCTTTMKIDWQGGCIDGYRCKIINEDNDLCQNAGKCRGICAAF